MLATWMTLNTESESQDEDRRPSQIPGGLGVWYAVTDAGEDAVGAKKEETDFVVIKRPKTSSKVHTFSDTNHTLPYNTHDVQIAMSKDSGRNYAEAEKLFAFRNNALPSYSRLELLMTYRDAHLYFFPHWTKRFIAKNQALETIGEDVVGFWAKSRWQKKLPQRLHMDEVLRQPASERSSNMSEDDQEHINIEGLSSTVARDLKSMNQEEEEFANDPGDVDIVHVRTGDPQGPSTPHSTPRVPRILGYFHDPLQPRQPLQTPTSNTKSGKGSSTQASHTNPLKPTPLIRRVDTVPLLLNCSLYLARQSNAYPQPPFQHAQSVHTTTTLPPQSRMSLDTVLIDANVELAPRITLSECVIGANCSIASGVNMSRCVLMEGAVVQGKAKLSGCVLGRKCVVGSGAELRDCSVQEGYQVAEQTVSKGEILAGFTEGEFDEGDEGDGDDGVAFG
ncbi:MAG: hypothetical protein M1831_005946 [Alyxoria varia]|nr:MAG: hypothetical protein M1831_005946 [Alyxoria varia]